MAAALHLVEGPAGGGKSQVVRDMLEAGEVEVVSDVTALWVAFSGARRGPDGRYPIRRDDDPALGLARYVQKVAVRQALAEGVSIAVTTSSPGQVARYRALASRVVDVLNPRVRTVDPGEAVVRARLADADGTVSPECDRAVRRWYG